jgi:peptidyl-Lys metalloendopeptidase
MLRPFLFAVLTVLGLPAAAMQFERCTKSEIAFATSAVEGAREVITRAAGHVGPTPEYERWFGHYSPDLGEKVRAGLKSVDRALESPDLVLVCPNTGEDGCDTGTYANVWPDDPFRVNLCRAFFGQPTMAGVVATSMAFDTGTREGTIIHEVSHFVRAAGTDDICYTRTDCSEMALTDSESAVRNADSFQYFAEDVVFAIQAAAAESAP